LIVKANLFGDCCINLISFSLGCVVVYYCIEELYNLKSFDKINNVILMGGAMNLKNIKSETL